MNKASLFPNHTLIRAILVFTLCAFYSLVSLQSVEADAAPPPDPTVGGIGPYQPQKTNVQMMSETVFIDVPESPPKPEPSEPIKVKANFAMRNQGQTDEQMQVIFPLTRLAYDYNSEPPIYRVNLSSFVAKVNGKPVPISQITTPAEIPEDPNKVENGFTMEVLWAAFPVTFPVQEDVLLQVEYEMLNQYAEMEGADFTGIEYILETGAGWYGKILSADITVRLPYLIEEIALEYVKPDYVISGKELHWTLNDFEPTRKDNLYVRVVQEESWKAIMDLRSKIKRNPKDIDAWVELAGRYESLAIYYAIGGQKANGFPYNLNHRTSDLAVEARRKVVELRPDWGNAHFRLAEILWYTNPKVEKIWGEASATLGSIPPNDPSIQEVLHELELAWFYGLSEDMSWDEEYLVEMINRTVPGLELAPPGAPTVTATMVPPTETLAPAATNTSLPTASPTIVPTLSATPIATESPSTSRNNVLLVVAIAVIIASGIYVFRWKSK
jgi:hypothetical protein